MQLDHVRMNRIGGRRQGFTLVEVLVAIAILAASSGAVFMALTGLNNFANHTRASVAALAIVQGSVEGFSATPYTTTPAAGSPLALGTRTTPDIPVITDPATNDVLVSGTLVTVVENGSRTSDGDVIAGRESLDLLRGTFTLTYQLRGRDLTFSQTTIKANDQ